MIRTKIERTPIIRQVYGYLMKRRFETNGYGDFWGVYKTFEEAIEAAPKSKHIGYNHAELAQEYQQMLEQNRWENNYDCVIADYDYPILFWLNSIFNQEEVKTIFDFGGNVGIHFYNYAKYLKYSQGLTWIICEVPEIAKLGRKIADKRGVDNLEFTYNFENTDGKDIFIALGSIQYIEDIQIKLSNLKRPRHLLINRLALYNGEQFVTLQNGGNNVYYPQYIFNKTEFIEKLESIGYKLIDIWKNRGDCTKIPLHPEKTYHGSYGLYFKLEN